MRSIRPLLLVLSPAPRVLRAPAPLHCTSPLSLPLQLPAAAATRRVWAHPPRYPPWHQLRHLLRQRHGYALRVRLRPSRRRTGRCSWTPRWPSSCPRTGPARASASRASTWSRAKWRAGRVSAHATRTTRTSRLALVHASRRARAASASRPPRTRVRVRYAPRALASVCWAWHSGFGSHVWCSRRGREETACLVCGLWLVRSAVRPAARATSEPRAPPPGRRGRRARQESGRLVPRPHLQLRVVRSFLLVRAFVYARANS